MRVILFIDNHSMQDVDISDLFKGNPGIGGTQYEMFLLARLLIEKQPNFDFRVVLTHWQKGFTYNCVTVVNTLEAVLDFCNLNKVDVLIMRECKCINLLNNLHVTNVIFWIHNFISYELTKQIGASSQIKRVVFVSKQHYDFYIEYNLNAKATYIFNSLAFPKKLPSISSKANVVVFTGNIVPIKRLHLVTKIWPYIKRKVPDAELLVIGTGASAHRDKKLGDFGLAAPEYEQVILKPLIRTNTLSSVHFLGILGTDKNSVIQTAKVGISPNKDETFCLSATEYILNGVPVVGVAKGGINDVVFNGRTGLLHRSLNRIKKDVVKILKGKKRITISADDLKSMEELFGFDVFLERWLKEIWSVFEGENVPILETSKPLIDKGKWIGSSLRCLRKALHLPERFTRLGLYRLIKK